MDVAKTKTPKTISVDELITTALVKAADSSQPMLLAGKNGGLFRSTSGANKEAIAICLNPEQPLLRVVAKQGRNEQVVLAPAGLERVLPLLPEEKVGRITTTVIREAPLPQRAPLIQAVIARVPAAAGELNPLLEETIAAEKAEAEARIQAAQKRRAEELAVQNALQKAMELLRQRHLARLEVLKREWEAEGQDPHELLQLLPSRERFPPSANGNAPPLKTPEEMDFRRCECDRLAAAWRDAWEDGKDDARDYLESAMWNIRGFRRIGDVGATVDFQPRYHDCDQPLLSGKVKIVRPGWLLKESEGDYVALKAVVTKV